jgi:ubiquinone/menaquinone biosynthesis C-methylase UbiE
MHGKPNEFYDLFADKYDVMILDERYDAELPFFKDVLGRHNVKSVLDCSCGTGKHVIRFLQLGFEATGSDVSSEMVKKAKKNAASLSIKASFVKADFKKLTKVFDREFDCVVCLGNSLNHELTERGMLSALKSMYGVLRNEGLIIIQIRNLPRLAEEKKKIFPIHFHKEANGDRKLFVYVLDFQRSSVTFNVVSFLEFDGEPRFEVDSVDYRIVSAEKLQALMTKAGFEELEIYGNFKFAKFSDKRSEDIVAIGRK